MDAPFSLVQILRVHATQSPDRPAILAPDREMMSYGELNTRVTAIAQQLREHGARRESSIALALPNGPDLAVAVLATMTTAACASLAPDRPRAEHERDLATMGTSVLIVARGHETAARDAAAALGVPILELERGSSAGDFALVPEPTHTTGTPPMGDNGGAALLLFTSGTTSRPKLVPLTEEHLLRSAANVSGALGLTTDDRCLNVMPLFHIHGLVAGLLASITAGGSVVCTPGFNGSEVWRWIDDLRPTWYTAVPTIHQAMLDASGKRADANGPIASSLRFVRSSSAALPARVNTDLERVLGVPVVEAYGMTEAAHQIASNPLPPAVRKAGTVGTPTGCEVSVRDDRGLDLPAQGVGEILLRGPSITAGYLDNPEANASAFVNGWFRTGDQGFLDEDGFLTLTGRLKEIINRGGEKVAPREVDDALLEYPEVRYAVAFAVPHPRLGEEVGAAVVLHDGATVTAAQLRVFVAERLAPYKVPRRVVVVDEIPRGATGKLDRSSLAARLGFVDASATSAATRVEPADELERELAAVFQDVLGDDEPPSVDADFFALGGDSLHATELLEAVDRSFHRRLPATVFFSDATVRGMADLLRGSAEEPSTPSLVPVQPLGSKAPLFCLMRAGSVVTLRHLAATLGPDQPVFGVWIPAMHGTRGVGDSVEELAAICVRLVLETQPRGPFFLFGHSLGGVVMFEAACQLARAGQEIGLVVIADAVHPNLMRASWERRHSSRYRVKKLLSRKGPAIVAWRVRNLLGRTPPKPVEYLPGTEIVADWSAAGERERRYRPGPARGPVVILATQQFLRWARSPDLGWAPVLGSDWVSVEVPGNHDSMIGEPHVHVLAARLDECLQRAQEGLAIEPVTAE